MAEIRTALIIRADYSIIVELMGLIKFMLVFFAVSNLIQIANFRAVNHILGCRARSLFPGT